MSIAKKLLSYFRKVEKSKILTDEERSYLVKCLDNEPTATHIHSALHVIVSKMLDAIDDVGHVTDRARSAERGIQTSIHEIDRLNRRIQVLEDEVKAHEEEISRETLIHKLNIEGGMMEGAFSLPDRAMRFLSLLLLEAIGTAENFQTISVRFGGSKDAQPLQQYEVTVRKAEGETPAESLGKLRAENETFRASIKRLEAQVVELKAGYERLAEHNGIHGVPPFRIVDLTLSRIEYLQKEVTMIAIQRASLFLRQSAYFDTLKRLEETVGVRPARILKVDIRKVLNGYGRETVEQTTDEAAYVAAWQSLRSCVDRLTKNEGIQEELPETAKAASAAMDTLEGKR